MIRKLLARFGFVHVSELSTEREQPIELNMDLAEIEPVEALKLNPSEKYSALWVKVKAYYAWRLHTLRLKNDSLGLSHEETLRLRGQIKEVKQLLALDQPNPGEGTDD